MKAAVILALAVVVAVCLPATRAAPADAYTVGQAGNSPCGGPWVGTAGSASGTKSANAGSYVYSDPYGNVGGGSNAEGVDRNCGSGCCNDGCGNDCCGNDGCYGGCDDGCNDGGCC